MLIPFHEVEARNRSKTKGGSSPVVSTPVHKYNGVPKQTGRKKSGRDTAVRSAPRASETPTVLAPQREARGPRLEETENGRELVPIRSVEP